MLVHNHRWRMDLMADATGAGNPRGSTVCPLVTARRERLEDPRDLPFRRVIGMVSHSGKSQAPACSPFAQNPETLPGCRSNRDSR